MVNFQSNLDAATYSLLILFAVNLVFMILLIVSFGIIRRVRGDTAKDRNSTKKKYMDSHPDLEALLIEKTKSKHQTIFTNSQAISF